MWKRLYLEHLNPSDEYLGSIINDSLRTCNEI